MVSRAAQGSHLFRWIWRQPRWAGTRPGWLAQAGTRCSAPVPSGAVAIRVQSCRRTAMTSVDTPQPACLARTADKAAVRQSSGWHNPQCAPGHRRCRSRSQASPAGSRPRKCHHPRHPVTGHSPHLIPKSDRPQSLRRWLRPDRPGLTPRWEFRIPPRVKKAFACRTSCQGCGMSPARLALQSRRRAI